MDLQMPEMGGLEATGIIRQQERDTGTHVRIVAMTAHAMIGDRERCIAAGMDAYLAKPINPQELYEAVEQSAPAAMAAADLPGPAVMDREEALERLGGDESLLREVCTLFVEDCPDRLAGMEEAMGRGAFAEVRGAAHGIKGAALNLSANRLAAAAKAFEHASDDEMQAVWPRVVAEARQLLETLPAPPSAHVRVA
jgi:CheY-like chemotaxis protein